ncbi:MAG: hypothetical protein FJ297_17300 [Planctomycetes bacterium]|nr:hypothetical protein [Planctomycetota bacterium]
MSLPPTFVDIHSHFLPAIDDGARTWSESLDMARMAAADGIEAIIVTPHQLGAYAHNRGDTIRRRTIEFQERLNDHKIPITVLPGADVRIDAEIVARLQSGDVLTLADRRRHVLLELPHDLYFPLDDLLEQLARIGLIGILSHPERNEGLLRQPEVVAELAERGCLMQVTAGSLLNGFGPEPRAMAEWMLDRGLIDFLATDAHGTTSRRPLLRRAFDRVVAAKGLDVATRICRDQPLAVVRGEPIDVVRTPVRASRRRGWFPWRRAG